MQYKEIRARSLLHGWSAVTSCPLWVCVPSCSPPPPSCWPWVCKFSVRPVLWQSCFLQRMCMVRNHWCEPQLKIPKLCSGGSSLAEMASLGMGWANGLGALTSVCRMVLEPASDRSSLTTKTQAMLPREWVGILLNQTHQKSVARIPPPRCWLVWLHSCMWALGVCHYIFWKFCLHSFHLNQAGAAQPLAAVGIRGWHGGVSGLPRDTGTPHLGQFSSWDENWVQFPENNFSYFNMKW